LSRCIDEIIQKKCNCQSLILTGFVDDEKKLCLFVDISDESKFIKTFSNVLCEVKILLLFENETFNHNCERCPWNCIENKYDTKISQIQWPHSIVTNDFLTEYVLLSLPGNNPIREYYDYLIKTVPFGNADDISNTEKFQTIVGFYQKFVEEFRPGKIISYSNNNTDLFPFISDFLFESKSLSELKRRWVKESFYRLNIYFGESFVSVHRQVATFSFEDFLSGIGGILGLWAGASMLTIIEFFFLLGSLMPHKLN
jgi:hypothetical protein